MGSDPGSGAKTLQRQNKEDGMRSFIVGLLLLTAAMARGGQFEVTTTPVNASGVRAVVDLPASQHHKNVGGSDGRGLCVYTSTWHTALWQSVRDIWGFRDWMRQQPGGSYPDKFDRTIQAYCRSTKVPVPDYVQHTGGELEFLRLVIKTGRTAGVTYCGVDGPGRYGSSVIGHMVTLVHLDDTYAAILDNNYPGTWLWMSVADFQARWTGRKTDGTRYFGMDERGRPVPIGGGWAIVFLASPPTPYASKSDIKDAPMPAPESPLPMVENHKAEIEYEFVAPIEAGPRPTPRHTWSPIPGAKGSYHGWGWAYWENRVPAPPPAPMMIGQLLEVAPEPKAKKMNHGVDSEHLMRPHRYTDKNGLSITRQEAFESLAQTFDDDSSRWNLSIVGDAAFVGKIRAELSGLPNEVANKLHVQVYNPNEWPVSQFSLPVGVTLRKPAANRIGAEVGSILCADYVPGKVVDLLQSPTGPSPKPIPKPTPAPPPVVKPDSQPAKQDDKPTTPAPSPDNSPVPIYGLIGLGFAAWLLLAIRNAITRTQ